MSSTCIWHGNVVFAIPSIVQFQRTASKTFICLLTKILSGESSLNFLTLTLLLTLTSLILHLIQFQNKNIKGTGGMKIRKNMVRKFNYNKNNLIKGWHFFHYFRSLVSKRLRFFFTKCHLKENTFFGKKKLKIKTFPLHHLFMSSAGTLISIYVKYKHICRLGIHVL